MKTKKSKNIIIIFAIISIVIIVILLALLAIIKNNTKNEENESNNNFNKEFIVDANNKKREKTESKLVEANDYNTFSIQAVTEESLLNKYMEDYRYNAIYHIQDSYNTLNQDYKEKRFENIEKYKEYLKDREETIRTMKLSKYQINKYDTYEQYICLDQYDNYYIFNKYPNMSYNVILDTHTIDLPQFTEKYKKSNDGEKAGLNIEKFIDAINQKDYEFAYNVLDNTFKENNFPNLSEFEKFIKENFYEKNQIEHLGAQKDEYIIYKIKIINKESNEQESKNLTIIMQLKDNTDFVMSFNFD
ncbi:MAG: hypothetical protein IKF97_01380 [Clostridia bacterium]|nr:hypothetical protein [Clostridia bacterium]